MSEAPTDAPTTGVDDRFAPRKTEAEASYFARVPADIIPTPKLGSGPKLLLGVLDRFAKGGDMTDTTDPQLATACGVGLNTISNWLAKLSAAGLIERVGRTCRRIIRLLFKFRGAATPRIGGSQLPQESGETTPGTGGNSPKNRGELPQKSGTSYKGEREKDPKAPSSSSCPETGDTPTTAKANAQTPPKPSAPPPPGTVARRYREEAEATEARDARLKAAWDAAPAPLKASIESKVRDDHPSFAGIPGLIQAYCLDALGRLDPERRQVVEVDPADVMVIPADSDRDVRWYSDNLTSPSPAMRAIAAKELREMGRSDIVDQVLAERKTRRPERPSKRSPRPSLERR